MEGWICPRCGKVHAPWVPECSCKPGWTIQYADRTTTTAGPAKSETKTYYGDIPEEMKL